MKLDLVSSEEGEGRRGVRDARPSTAAAAAETAAAGACGASSPPKIPTELGENEDDFRPVLGPLETVGFELETVSPKLVSGRLKVTDACVQPFKVLHGGVSALVAEGLASVGAHVASRYRRVAGVQLSINHLRPARLGDVVTAEATPVHVGRTIQVWEVKLWTLDSATSSKKQEMVASSRVTLLTNLPVPQHAAGATEALRKRAKL